VTRQRIEGALPGPSVVAVLDRLANAISFA
jgi:hypothetical protein